MSIPNRNELENFEEGEFKDLRQLLNIRSKKWKEEKPFYFALKMLIQDFWKYIFTIVSSKSNAENLLNDNVSCGEIKKILEQEKSKIEQTFRELVSNRKTFLIDKVETSKEDFDKKMEFYLNKVFSIYNKIKENESLIKDNMSLYERSKLNKKLSPDILFEIVKGYIKNEIPFLSENLNYRDRVAPPSQENFENKLLQEILSDVNAFREDLKYGEYPDNEKQLGINYILFLLKFCIFLKISIADRRNFSERMNLKVELSKILESKKIKEEKKNFLNNLRHFIDPYKNDKQTQAKLIRFSMEKNLFSFLKIIKNSNAVQDNINSILKNEFGNFLLIKNVLIPTLEETMQNKNENNICDFEFIENNSSIKNFIRIFRILEIHYSTLENRKILFDKYSKFNWDSFEKHNEYNYSSNIPNGDASAPQIYINIERNKIVKKLINFLENEIIKKLPLVNAEDSTMVREKDSNFDQTILNELLTNVKNNSDPFNLYLTINPNNNDSNMTILVEKFRFDNKPVDSFIRSLIELINILEYGKIKKELMNHNPDFHISEEENIYYEMKIQEIQSQLKIKYLKEIKVSKENEVLLDKALFYLTKRQYEDALCSLKSLFRKCEAININYMRYLITKTEEAAVKIKGKKVILLLGKTGTGKSTLTLFFSGVKLTMNEKGDLIPEKQNYENPELYNIIPKAGFVSETRFLTAIENSSEKLNNRNFSNNNNTYIVCDSPGLEDTRDVESEISNNIGLLKGIVDCEMVCPVLVTTLNFGERFQDFIKLLKSIRGMVSKPDIIKKFTFLANKCSEDDLKKFKAILKKFRENLYDNLNAEDKDDEFVKYVSKISKTIIDKITWVDPLNDDFRKILNENILDDENNYLKNLSSVFNLPFSENIHNKTNEFVQMSKDSILISVKIIQESNSVDYDYDFKKNVDFQVSLIYYHISNLIYLNEIIKREDVKEKLDLIISDLENFLDKIYREQIQIMENSLKPENNILGDELKNYNKSYKISKAFDEKLKKIFSENCITHEAYLTTLNNHFNVLVEDICIANEEEIKKTNKIFKIVKMILENHPELKTGDLSRSYLVIKFLKNLEKYVIEDILKTQSKYENLFNEKNFEDLFEQQIRMYEIVLYFEKENSGFAYALNFFIKSLEDAFHNVEEEDNPVNLEFVREEKRTIKKELLSFIEEQRVFNFIKNKINSLKLDILELFNTSDLEYNKLREFEDKEIQNMIEVLKSFEKLKEFKYGDISKTAKEAIKGVGENVRDYIYFLNLLINAVLECKTFLNEPIKRSDSIKIRDITNFKGRSGESFLEPIKSEITNVYLDLKYHFENISKIEKIEILSNFTDKPIMECQRSLETFMNLFEKNAREVYENIKNLFTDNYQLKMNCERLKTDVQIISKSEFLMERRKDFLDKLKFNFGNAILIFLEERDYFGILNLNENKFKKKDNTSTYINAVNGLCVILKLKDIFPELSKLECKLKNFNSVCEKILKDIDEIFSEERLKSKISLKKNKTIEFLELCEKMDKLSSDSAYKQEFKDAKNKIESFLESFNNEIIHKLKKSFFEEINKFELSNYFEPQKLDDLNKKAEDWYFALYELKIIEKNDSISHIFSEEEDFESLWDDLNLKLKLKITDSILNDLEEEVNINDEKLNVIPKIIEIFEKFEKTFTKNDYFSKIKDEYKTLKKVKIPKEIKSGTNLIDEGKYEEVLVYLEDISKVNFQETKRNIYSELKTYLAKNIHELIQANEISLNKLRNSDYESWEVLISEISKHLKNFKQIEDLTGIIKINNHIDVDKYNKILLQYENSLKELNEVFQKISENIKEDIDNYNFKMYLEKKDFLSRNLNKIADFIVKGTPLNEPFIDNFKKSFENKIKEIIASYKESFDNFIRVPPKDIYSSLKNIPTKESESFYLEIKNILNYYLSTIENGSIPERDLKINNFKNHYSKFLPEALESEFKIVADKIENKLVIEKKDKINELERYINAKQHTELNKFWKSLINYDTDGTLLQKVKKFISEEIWSVEKKINESYDKGNFVDMYSEITNFDKLITIYKENFSDCTHPILIHLRKFLETKLSRSCRFLISTFSNEEEYSDFDFRSDLSDVDYDASGDNLFNNNSIKKYPFYNHFSLFQKTLIFRQEHLELYVDYIEKQSEFSFENVFELITENLQITIYSFESSLLKNGLLDFSSLSFSYSNILRWRKNLIIMKRGFLEEKNNKPTGKVMLTDDGVFYKRGFFFDEDLKNEIIKKFLNSLRNFDWDYYKKTLDNNIKNIKSEIFAFSFTQQPQDFKQRQREDILDSLLVKMELIEKIAESNISGEKSLLSDILTEIQDNIQKSFKIMTSITEEIQSKNLMIVESDVTQLSYIYENLKSFNNVLGKFFSKNKIELKMESNLLKVNKSLEGIFRKVTDNCFDLYSKSKYKLEKISEILTSLKNYSNKWKFMKEYIDTLIDSILERTQKTDKDKVAMKRLGELLSQDIVGKNILDESNILEECMDNVHSNKPGASFDIKDILGKIKAENIELNKESKIIGLNRSLNKSPLEDYYDSYLKYYERYLNQNLYNQNQEKRFENLLGSLRSKIYFKINHKPEESMWDYDMVSSIPEILAIISVIWTLTFSNNYFEISPHDREDKYLNKPHVNQILTILFLLCIDKNEFKIFNNLVSTGMGEGKSTIISLIAALLALYGFNVNVLCFNSFLSSKEHGEYLIFFQRLGVSKYIFYGDYKAIGQRIINENGDIREITKNLIFPDSNSNIFVKISVEDDSRPNGMSNQGESKIKNDYKSYLSDDEDSDNYHSNYRPNLLLINEIDALLDKSFYENQFMPNFIYKHENINDLFDFIWHKRSKLFDIQKEKDSFFDYEEEKSKRYLEFKNALVQSREYNKCLELFSSCPELLTQTVKDIISDLMEFKSLPKYDIENDKIAYKNNQMINENIHYRYKTVFAYYEEFDKKRISGNSLKQNVHFIFNCGHFSYPEIFKEFKHIMGVSEALLDLNEIEKKFLGSQYKIFRYVFMPSSTKDNNQILKNKVDFENIHIAENKESQMREIVNKLSSLFSTYSKLYLPKEANMGDKKQQDTSSKQKIVSYYEAEQCVIIFFENIYDLEQFNDSFYFRALNRPYEILTEKTPKQDIENKVRQACRSGSITLATRAFVRGLDFIVKDQAVIDAGGLLIIQAFLSVGKSEEIHIKSYSSFKSGSGSYNLILNREQLQAMKIHLNNKSCTDHKDLFNLIDVQRRKILDANLTSYLENQMKNKDIENESKQFLKKLQNRETSLVKKYILEFNKGKETKEKNICRTKIYLDATLSMDGLIKLVNKSIGDIFTRTFDVLKSQNINDQSISIQICAYRNYDCSEEMILQRSPWEFESENLVNFLNKVSCVGGWGNEAIEIALWDILHTKPNISQAIIIGDRRANTKEEIQSKRSSAGSFKGDFEHPNEYWNSSKYSRVGECGKMIDEINKKNIKLHGFYVLNEELTEEKQNSTKMFFEEIAAKTDGVSHSIDIESNTSKEVLTRFIVEEILKNISRNSGLKSLEKTLLNEYNSKYFA